MYPGILFLSICNSADPDVMPHDAAFHLGLKCLQNYMVAGIQNKNGLMIIQVVKILGSTHTLAVLILRDLL